MIRGSKRLKLGITKNKTKLTRRTERTIRLLQPTMDKQEMTGQNPFLILFKDLQGKTLL
jgi:hypothetical protein